MNPAPLRRLLTRVAAAVLGVSVLTSCASKPDLDDAVAAQLQSRVAATKQLAAQQDFPAALSELGQLSEEVATAAEQGRMTQQRRSRIEAAIGTIRSDLEATLPPPPTVPSTAPQLTEDQQEQAEEAQKDAEEQREEAQKEAQKQRDEAQKDADKQRDNR